MRQTAVLVEETTPEVLKIKLGQLKPGSGATIKLTYISELPAEGDSIRLTIPTTIAPRYAPPTDTTEAASDLSSIKYSSSSPAPMSLNLEVTSQSKIKSIKSPSHAVLADLNQTPDRHGQFGAKVRFSGTTTDMDRDLVVLVEAEDPHQPVVFIEKAGEDKLVAAMVSLVPSFRLKDQQVELIFLVDRSGSMNGSSIRQAKNALELFLHSLPADCYFNIFSFGSSFDSLFSASKKYDDDTLASAKALVAGMEANYGGTEIYQPLDFIFKQPLMEGHLRQVFVLTDGEVTNGAAVIKLVKRNNRSGRTFSLGLGASASRHLVKGIARSGGGTAAFTAVDEDLRPKVMAQLKNALQPSITDVDILWDGTSATGGADLEPEPEVETQKTLLGYNKPKKTKETKSVKLEGLAPRKIPPVYDGSRLLIYHLFDETERSIPKTVTVTAKTPDGPLSLSIPVDESCHISGHFVHQLAARKRIQDLEEQCSDSDHEVAANDIELPIIELATKYSLVSSKTSFVGVDKKSPNNLFELEMVTREIANQVPFGFGMQLRSGGTDRMVRCRAWSKSMSQPQCKSSNSDPAGWSFGSAGLSLSSGQTTSSKFSALAGALFGSTAPCGGSVLSSAPAFGSGPPGPGLESMTDGCSGRSRMAMARSGRDQDRCREEKSISADSAGDDLTLMVRLQSASGSFAWGDVIGKLFKTTKEDLMGANPGCGEDVWITALAIRALEEMASQKDLWELVVQKAKKFLMKQLGEAGLENLLAAAAGKIPRN